MSLLCPFYQALDRIFTVISLRSLVFAYAPGRNLGTEGLGNRYSPSSPVRFHLGDMACRGTVSSNTWRRLCVIGPSIHLEGTTFQGLWSKYDSYLSDGPGTRSTKTVRVLSDVNGVRSPAKDPAMVLVSFWHAPSRLILFAMRARLLKNANSPARKCVISWLLSLSWRIVD